MDNNTFYAITDSFNQAIPEAISLFTASQDWREATWNGSKSLTVKIEDCGGQYPYWVEQGKAVPLNTLFEGRVDYQIQWSKVARAWDVQKVRADDSGVGDTIFSIPEGCNDYPPESFVQLVKALLY